MDAQERVDRKVWEMLVVIKEKDLLSHWSDGGVINLGHISEEQKSILLWLRDEKAITLLNLDRDTLPRLNLGGRLPEEIKLRLNHPDFDEIYAEYKVHFTVVDPEEFKGGKTNKNYKVEIREIIKTQKIKGMQEKYIKTLWDMKIKTTKEMEGAIGTKDLKNLTYQVKQKLRGTSLDVKVSRAKSVNGSTYYQLKFLTQ